MNIASNYEQLVKVLILGDSNVGKTNFLLRFTENNFVENYITTIGFDYKSSVINVDDSKIKLQVWDTAGQERFMSVTKNLLLRVQGIIVMYDITSVASFDNVKKWVSSIRENANVLMPIIIVGNKCDLEANRQVPMTSLVKLAEEFNVDYLEASAKDDYNVKNCFVTLAKKVLVNPNVNRSSVKLDEGKEGTKTRCC